MIDWRVLNHEYRQIIDSAVKDWTKLLDDKSKKEPAYQNFIANNAGLFFYNPIYTIFVISKLKLGSIYETDFVVPLDQESYGFSYQLIEIQSPHAQVFNAQGHLSSAMNEALTQVSDWRRWLDQYRDYAKGLFPSKMNNVADNPHYSFTIIIGRRSTNSEFLSKWDLLSSNNKVAIHSFDYLTDQMVSRIFPKEILTSYGVAPLDNETSNKLANPFFASFSDSLWKKMLRESSLPLAHMSTSLGPLILKHREYSERFSVFQKII